MKIKELLSSKEKWTKKQYARNKDGVPVDIQSKEASCWCLAGAIMKCYPNRTLGVSLLLQSKVGSIAKFNDGTDFETVKKLLEEMDI